METFLLSLSWILSALATISIARAFRQSWWWLVAALLLPYLSVMLITLVVLPESRRMEQEKDERYAAKRAPRQKPASKVMP